MGSFSCSFLFSAFQKLELYVKDLTEKIESKNLGRKNVQEQFKEKMRYVISYLFYFLSLPIFYK